MYIHMGLCLCACIPEVLTQSLRLLRELDMGEKAPILSSEGSRRMFSPELVEILVPTPKFRVQKRPKDICRDRDPFAGRPAEAELRLLFLRFRPTEHFRRWFHSSGDPRFRT